MQTTMAHRTSTGHNTVQPTRAPTRAAENAKDASQKKARSHRANHKTKTYVTCVPKQSHKTNTVSRNLRKTIEQAVAEHRRQMVQQAKSTVTKKARRSPERLQRPPKKVERCRQFDCGGVVAAEYGRHDVEDM